jgi:CheY-like chemotaxis protein
MANGLGTVDIPVEDVLVGMATQQSSGSPSETGAPDVTVLFVDDEPDTLEVYHALCRPLFDVRTASSGEAALAAVDSHVDFVFVDRRMPGMSGDELIQTLREQGYEMPIAILSATEPDPAASNEHDAYLTKPTGKDQIRETVSQHLS